MTSIAETCLYQLSLINDLLDLSKSAAGRLKIASQACDATALAGECFRFVQPQAELLGLQLEFQSKVGNAWVSADPLRVRQMLMNLLGNALKFTQKGGLVTLWLARPRPGWISFGVQDTGIGIGSGCLPDVFQPFHQVEKAQGTSGPAGSGLGLAIVKELAEAQKGRVLVSSEPGCGSTFVVEIPEVAPPVSSSRVTVTSGELQTPDPSLPDGATSPGSGDAKGLRVMVVEDHDLNRELVTDYLTAEGFEVHSFLDGIRALQALPELRPNVVIMDVQMPGLDGLEVTRQIRQSSDRGICAVPILGLTALAMPEDRDRCIAAGMNAYQGKPFSLKALPGVLRRMVSDSVSQA
jgi:CheY-like chemotaxis protein